MLDHFWGSLFRLSVNPLFKKERSGHLNKYSEASIRSSLLGARLSAWQSGISSYPWSVSSLLVLVTSDGSPSHSAFPSTLDCLYVVVNHSQHHVFLCLCWNKNPLFSTSARLAPRLNLRGSSCPDFQDSEHTPKGKHLPWAWERNSPVNIAYELQVQILYF